MRSDRRRSQERPRGRGSAAGGASAPARSRPRLGVAAAALAALLLAGLVGCGASGAGEPLALPKSPAALPGSTASHVAVIVMENKAFVDVIGSRRAPYVNALVRRSAVPTNYFGITHPSLPNYLALTGGSTFGVTSDHTHRHFPDRNLVDQLAGAGISWKAYMEDMPSPCFKGASSGGYAKKHDPFLYYDSVLNDPKRCSKVVPYRELGNDLASGHLPAYSFITPNLCDDMHNCDVGAGDRFLAGIVPSILRELGPHGVLFLTWDEGRSNRGCCGGTAAGGRIPTIVAGPDVRAGSRPSTPYSHYSLLRTIERSFGLPFLGKAACPCTSAMDAVFTRPPRLGSGAAKAQGFGPGAGAARPGGGPSAR